MDRLPHSMQGENRGVEKSPLKSQARAGRKGARAGSREDASEIIRVDVQYRITEDRVVQHIDGIDTQLKLPGLRDSDCLSRTDVESNISRAFEPSAAESAEFSGSGIYKKEISVSAGDCVNRALRLESLQRGDCATARIFR